MKVLITGAGGQVGRSLAANAPGGTKLIATTRGELDIVNEAATAAAINHEQPDLIINAAAYTAVDKAESEPKLARQVNEIGARNLAEAAAQSGARLIHISTDFVFDGKSSVPYLPSDTPAPLGTYGKTKLAGERAVLGCLPDRSIVLRTAWVYAPLGRNFVLTMLRLMREKGSVRVVSDQIGSPTSGASIADAIWAFSARADVHGTFHWTDAGVTSWYDFAVAISEEAAACGLLPERAEVIPISTEDYPTPARRPAFSVLDCQATIDEIGIEPPHWRDSLKRVLEEIKRG